MQLIPRIWLSLFYSSDPNSQTSNWLEGAEYILCKFIEHGLQIHQHQPCFPSKTANHRKNTESPKEEVFMKLYCYYYKCCGCSKLSKYLSANLSLTLPTTDLTSIHVLETQKHKNHTIFFQYVTTWWTSPQHLISQVMMEECGKGPDLNFFFNAFKKNISWYPYILESLYLGYSYDGMV